MMLSQEDPAVTVSENVAVTVSENVPVLENAPVELRETITEAMNETGCTTAVETGCTTTVDLATESASGSVSASHKYPLHDHVPNIAGSTNLFPYSVCQLICFLFYLCVHTKLYVGSGVAY